MALSDFIKAMGNFGAGAAASSASSAAFGAGPRFIPPVGPAATSRGSVLGAADALADAQARTDELTKRTEVIRRNPVVQAFLEMPSRRALELQADRLAAQRQAIAGFGAGPRPSTLEGATRLLDGDFSRVGAAGKGTLPLGSPQDRAHGWQPLGPFGGGDRTGPPLVASRVATNLRNLNLAGTRGPLFDSGVGVLARAYHPPWAAAGPFDPSVLGGLGKLVQGYLGVFGRLEELIAGWRRPVEGFLKQVARRAWELYPRDSEGRPIPPWNLRLYFLAWAAYRLDDYEAQARFLDAIGADDSVDNVLFVHDLLAPTFDPARPDRRTDWWHMGPDEAKAWLRKRLEHRGFEIRMDEYRRRGRQISYAETGDLEGPDGILREHLRGRAPRDASAEWQFFEEESAALILQELAAVLSERQLQVVARFLEEQSYEQRTYEEIGRELGMAPGTVKSHVFRVRNNPGVSEILKPDGAQTHKRPHRR